MVYLKRLVVAGAVAVGAALPVSALAAGHFFQGNTSNGGHVEFHAKFHNHRATKILTFAWDSVPANNCLGVPANGELDHAVDVNSNGKFHYSHTTQTGSPTTVAYTGDFNSQYTKATGTLRVSGYIAGGGTACDTGKLTWKAHP